MKRNSITLKTLLYISTYAIIVLLILWVFETGAVGYFYSKFQLLQIEKVAKEIKKNKDLESDDLEEYAYQNDMCLEYISESGTVGYNLKSRACILSSNESIKYKLYLINTNNDIDYITYEDTIPGIIYKVNLDDGSYVLLNTNLADINQTSLIIKNLIVYFIIFLIFFSIIVAIFISRNINKPLLKIINKARELEKGNYKISFDKSNISELDELADVLTVAASEMNKTDELKRDLIANVSHDLKTPLTMIRAYAEKVRDLTYKDPEKREKDLNVIIEETERLNGLVNDLLDLSKLQANKSELNITSFDLVEDIQDIIKRYDIVKEKDNYNFILDLPKTAIIDADKSKIDQVIYNLVNNAIEHTGDDLTVKIAIKLYRGVYTVSVTDTGKGISEEDKVLVWNKYYKKEKNHKRNVVGSGIGLSIVKEVLEKHNFEYGIDSELGKYTTFYFKVKKSM